MLPAPGQQFCLFQVEVTPVEGQVFFDSVGKSRQCRRTHALVAVQGLLQGDGQAVALMMRKYSRPSSRPSSTTPTRCSTTSISMPARCGRAVPLNAWWRQSKRNAEPPWSILSRQALAAFRVLRLRWALRQSALHRRAATLRHGDPGFGRTESAFGARGGWHRDLVRMPARRMRAMPGRYPVMRNNGGPP